MSNISRLLLIIAGLTLVFATGLIHAQEASYETGSGAEVSVSVSVQAGYQPTHYCSWNYGYYSCYGSAPAYVGVAYCDYFDPYYYRYCYAPYYGYYPTYTVNPGTVVYVNGVAYPANQAPSMPPCSDGTPSGMCSTDSPKYCFNGQLFDKATACGCPAGQVPDATNRNRCVAQTCTDGTSLNACSVSTQPKYCTANGVLVDRPTQCGCPSGTKLEGSVCAPLNSACYISSSLPSTVEGSGSSVVTVVYNDVQPIPTGSVTCGNGQIVPLTCSSSTASNRGTCTATCNYVSTTNQPVTNQVRATVSGNLCSSGSSVNLMPQVTSAQSVLAKVTSCESGQAISGAVVSIGSEVAYTDANGNAQFQFNAGSIGSKDFQTSATGYRDALTTANVQAGRTTLLPICLQRETRPSCDVSLAFEGTAQTNQVPQQLQLRVTNNEQVANSVVLTYSGAFPVTGPTALQMAAGETRVVTLQPVSASSAAGSSLVSVNAVGNNGQSTCSANTVFSYSLNNGVSIDPLQTQRTVYAGEKACFDFVIRNTASQKADVLLTSSSLNRVELEQTRFTLAPRETRQLQACMYVPEGAVGSTDMVVNADTSLNDVSTRFTVSTKGQPFSNVQSCYQLNGTGSQYVEVKVSNDAAGESMYAQLDNAGTLRASLSQDQIYNFQTHSTRSLFLRVDGDSLENGRGQSTLSLFSKATGQQVMQQALCFVSRGWFDSSAYLAPTRLQVVQGNTVHTFLTVRNAGNTADTYEVELAAPFNGISLSRSRTSLQAGASSSIDVAIRPSQATQAGAYVVPVAVYSLGASTGHRTQVASLNLVVDVLPVVPSGQLRLVLASQPIVQLRSLDSAVKVFANVSNFEDAPRTITASVEGLPAGWTSTVLPAGGVYLTQLQSGQFEYTLNYDKLNAQDYNVTLVFTDETGRQVRQPIVLPAKSNSWATTGFFTLGAGDAFLGIIALLLLTGLFLTYRSWTMRQELGSKLM